jgi:threonine efflux protein
MEFLSTLAGIAIIHFFAISSPGPTLFIVAGHASAPNRDASFFVVLGVVCATLIWSSFAAAGLGTLVNAVAWLPVTIRIAGGLYLAWFGFKMLRSAWTGRGAIDIEDATASVAPMAALRAGFVTNISNPKVIAYYVSLFGVMIPANASVPLYAAAVATAVFVSTVWWSTVALFFRLPAVRRVFTRVRRGFDAVVGAALVAFGIKLISGR